MRLVIQRVSILYGKLHRGMPGSQKRADLPRAFALWPDPRANVFQCHTFHAFDSLDFVHRAEECRDTRVTGDRVRIGCLSANVGRAELVLDIRSLGKPMKRGSHAPLQLAAGGWARLITNGRFVDSHGGQHYEEDTYNVGLFAELDDEIFLRTEPSAVLDDRADL